LVVLGDVSIKVGDFYMPIDFMILEMAEDAHTQIIIGRPLLATASCEINVKEGKLTFEKEENHVEFGLFNDCESSPSIFSCCGCEAIILNEHVNILDIHSNDPPIFYYASFEGQGFDNVKVESMPPSIVKDEPYAVNERYSSDCCRFVTLIKSMPTVSRVECDIDVDIEIEFEGGPFDGTHPRIVISLR